MNKQQAHNLMSFIQAFIEDVPLEYRRLGEETWYNVVSPTFDIEHYQYRIKPKPEYRPFQNAEECWQEMQKHKPFGWLKDKEDGHYTLVTAINKNDVDQIALNGNTGWLFSSISKFYTFADNTPFGIKEE